MKTIKTLFAILFVSAFIIACEADSVNDQVGIDQRDIFGTEDEDEQTSPDERSSEDEDEYTEPK